MPLEPQAVSQTSSEGSLGSLRSCLVEGDTEQRNRERRVRRHSLIISILIQTAVLAVLALLPLFGKTEHIALAVTTPIPPYGHPHHAPGPTRPLQGHHPSFGDRITFFSPTASSRRPSSQGENTVGPPDIGAGGNESESGPECSWCIDIGGRSNGPRPPQTNAEVPSKPRVVNIATIDPALLIHRVEPVYPPLAKQIHKEGRVELHAIIATDGTIQSLEVASGDPLFYQSALEAVRQWRYKPTMLSGQPVAIDTYITVIYTMQH
jgi:periplasmic protein TonB